MNGKNKRAWLAATAAICFGAACTPEGDATAIAKVQCDGANSCKGKSECATAHSECNGQNSCKGKGWVQLTPEECESAGGTAKPA
jgi:hypothetical protein